MIDPRETQEVRADVAPPPRPAVRTTDAAEARRPSDRIRLTARGETVRFWVLLTVVALPVLYLIGVVGAWSNTF